MQKRSECALIQCSTVHVLVCCVAVVLFSSDFFLIAISCRWFKACLASRTSAICVRGRERLTSSGHCTCTGAHYFCELWKYIEHSAFVVFFSFAVDILDTYGCMFAFVRSFALRFRCQPVRANECISLAYFASISISIERLTRRRRYSFWRFCSSLFLKNLERHSRHTDYLNIGCLPLWCKFKQMKMPLIIISLLLPLLPPNWSRCFLSDTKKNEKLAFPF